ncbi:hypothetical protein IHE44_0013714 [Lamprotornis superbus]|uniref:Serpin domain-containing protein n=1 Tax=Lamprotornis superbus TaxID=245042 RepID=A0A835NZR0_9PASS|nr:hypothetical protein IHE44_0013714 [Lamprotornis superbus]
MGKTFPPNLLLCVGPQDIELFPRLGSKTMRKAKGHITQGQGDTPRQELRSAAQGPSGKVDISFPKFKLEQKYKMKKLLQGLGIKKLFTRSADLSHLTDHEYVAVSQVVQKAVIEVDEEGTEAAAASGSQITAFTVPPVIKVDRPFLFMIFEETFKTLLFIGRNYIHLMQQIEELIYLKINYKDSDMLFNSKRFHWVAVLTHLHSETPLQKAYQEELKVPFSNENNAKENTKASLKEKAPAYWPLYNS